jgi:hypothetical protein
MTQVSEQDAPFTEPYAKAGNPNGFKSKGNTALAVKRAMAHLGFLEWEPDKWDEQWNEKLNTATAAWKRKRGLIPEDSSDGSWGKKSHDTMRGTWFGEEQKPAFDGESQRLLKEEKKASAPPPPQESPQERVREAITSFCTQGIGEPDWYYSQARAIDKEVSPNGPSTSDCSGSVIQIFWYAKKQTGLNVPDPAMQGWSGYGNTQYYECDHPTVNSNGPFQIGDLAHYDGHVTCCYRAGDAQSADWWSFGSEPPSSRKLHYRDDFWKVVRPPLVQ